MRHRKKNRRRANRPFRYLPILLIATAIAESVHAPFVQHSEASTPKPESGKPAAAAATSPPGNDPKKPGTWTGDPVRSSDDQNSQSKATEQALDALLFPTPDATVPSNLLPPVPEGPASLSSVGAPPSNGGSDPFVQLPPTWDRPPVEYGFSGLVVPNGIVNNGPVNNGPVTRERVGQTTLITTPVAAVPEPGSVLILSVGALALLRRRPR